MTHSSATPSTAEGFLLTPSPAPSPPRRAVILANGELRDPQTVLSAIRPDDWLIAADGGAMHLRALGLRPHAVIGDFDSLHPRVIGTLEQSGAVLERHPAHKDETDLELAVRYTLSQGFTDILIFGALGGRWDQTLANLLLPAQPEFSAARIRLVDGRQQIFPIRGSGIIEGQPGDIVSLVPLNGDVHGITTDGLEYPLRDETLFSGTTRGISNVLLGESARVTARQGVLLCVVVHSSMHRLE